tara:strand:- start:58 stop:390 length:333 start_codon:yes stop_codon:yes gene_type:complete
VEGNRGSRRSSFALDSFKIIANIKQLHCRQDQKPVRQKKQINGAVAQLGACLNGIQEVAGSIPASSTFILKRVNPKGLTPFFVEYTFVVDLHHFEFLIRWGCLEKIKPSL